MFPANCVVTKKEPDFGMEPELTSSGELLHHKDTKFTLCEGCREPILDRLVKKIFYEKKR